MRRSLLTSYDGGRPPQARWGVVQPVGHHTVNVDGEGSNPSAPANFPSKNSGIAHSCRFDTELHYPYSEAGFLFPTRNEISIRGWNAERTVRFGTNDKQPEETTPALCD